MKTFRTHILRVKILNALVIFEKEKQSFNPIKNQGY